jgi:hypothetical protein
MQDRYHTYATDPPRRPASEIAEERREQIAHEQAERQADKDRKLIRQRSIETTPEVRIALWESRHGLALPREPGHPLMRFIAESTDLSVEQVHAEQQRRALVRAGSTSR